MKENVVPLDTRVAYGARCTWWGLIREVGHNGNLPACPHCGGMLFEVENEGEWWKGVRQHAKKEPGYEQMIKWAHGKCFRNFDELRAAYEKRETE
jgi:hypothetical protein